MITIDNTSLTDYDWREENLRCRDCKYFGLIDDFNAQHNRKVSCKNMDYVKYWISVPWFCSHCTGENKLICRQFVPSSYKIWLNQRFTCPDDFVSYQITHGYLDFHKSKVPFIKAGNRNVTYDIYYRDFYYRTYENEDGSLKYARKSFFKKYKKNGTCSYLLVHEEGPYTLQIEEETYLDVLQYKFKKYGKVLQYDGY